jgi:hypothetical protein
MKKKKPSAKVVETRQRLIALGEKIIRKEKREKRAELKKARIPSQTRIELENEGITYFSPDELEAYASLEEIENRANNIFAEQLKKIPNQSTIFHEASMIRYLASHALHVLLMQALDRLDSEGEDWKQIK